MDRYSPFIAEPFSIVGPHTEQQTRHGLAEHELFIVTQHGLNAKYDWVV